MSDQLKVLVPLPHAATAIRQQFGVQVTYGRLYRGILDGQVPAHRNGARIELDEHGLAEAAKLGRPVRTAA